MDRIATTTEFNSLPILDGNSEKPETLILRVAEPFRSDLADSDSGDINEIRFENLKDIIATAEGLGVRSAADSLESEMG